MKRVLTLCGSVRFKSDFEKVNHDLSLRGWIILAPGVFEHKLLHEDEDGKILKGILDELHFRKIDMSDGIVVINTDYHVGESTRNEIAYAIEHKKEIFWVHMGEDTTPGRSWEDLLK